jgi:cyclopropane-fatty-acyl-phospholipid synthase
MKHQNAQTFPVGELSRPRPTSRSNPVDRWLVRRIQREVPAAPIRFELWDGFDVSPSVGSPVATIVFRTRRALLAWAWDPELNFGEAYMSGDVEIRGDLVALLQEIYRAWPEVRRRLRFERTRNGVREARENVHHHYDLGNDFYELWLDREMLYTCAYFPAADSTLEAAQIAKMDRVCRKLQLKPGERVVEAGCGWGSLARFMAKQYGVSVWAYNVSAEQIAYARERAERDGVADRVHFIEDDYRNIDGTYDAFVSVGMLEHVGASNYPTFGRVIDRSLTRRGRGLLHFIGRDRPMPLNAWIRKRIFPGAHTPTLTEALDRVLEPAGLSVLDVENLRLHYAMTLDHWRRRFETHSAEVAGRFDDAFVRAWRLYLAGSQAAFAAGCMQLFQVVFARAGSNALPGRVGT